MWTCSQYWQRTKTTKYSKCGVIVWWSCQILNLWSIRGNSGLSMLSDVGRFTFPRQVGCMWRHTPVLTWHQSHSDTSRRSCTQQNKCSTTFEQGNAKPASLPIVPVRLRGSSFVGGPSSSSSGVSRWDESPLRPVSSDRHVREKQLTVNVEARKHGERHAQH